MRKSILFFGLYVALAVVAISAENGFDADLMQKIEDATRSVDSNVSLKDAKAATADAKEIEALLRQVEAWYAQKSNAADAVAFAQKSRGLADEVARSATAEDFETASSAVSALAKSCKACHQVYKKN